MNHENFKVCIDTCNNLSAANDTQTDQKEISKKAKMKITSKISLLAFLISFLLFSTTSCVVVNPTHHDSGKHKGWFKSSNHPQKANNNYKYEKENNSKGKHKKH